MVKINYDKLPKSLREGVRLYLEKRIQPGYFLSAVLTNNLTEAIFSADKENLKKLPEIVQFFYNEVPHICWGSVSRVEKWLEGAHKDLI